MGGDQKSYIITLRSSYKLNASNVTLYNIAREYDEYAGGHINASSFKIKDEEELQSMVFRRSDNFKQFFSAYQDHKLNDNLLSNEVIEMLAENDLD